MANRFQRGSGVMGRFREGYSEAARRQDEEARRREEEARRQAMAAQMAQSTGASPFRPGITATVTPAAVPRRASDSRGMQSAWARFVQERERIAGQGPDNNRFLTPASTGAAERQRMEPPAQTPRKVRTEPLTQSTEKRQTGQNPWKRLQTERENPPAAAQAAGPSAAEAYEQALAAQGIPIRTKKLMGRTPGILARRQGAAAPQAAQTARTEAPAYNWNPGLFSDVNWQLQASLLQDPRSEKDKRRDELLEEYNRARAELLELQKDQSMRQAAGNSHMVAQGYDTQQTRPSSRLLAELPSPAPKKTEEDTQREQETEKARARMEEADRALRELGWDRERGIYGWDGREQLQQEYQELQRELQRIDNRPSDRPVSAQEQEETDRKRARLEEVRRLLEQGDRDAGNGAADYSFSDRADSVFGGAAKNVAASIGKAGVVTWDALNKAGSIQYTDMEMDEYLDEQTRREVQAMRAQAYESPEFREKLDAMYKAVGALGQSGAADLERAKNGLSKLGKAGVDIASNLLEMGFDAGVGALTGGGGSLASMFVRVYGDEAYNALSEGAPLEKAVLFGAVKGGIEVFTEKLADGVAKVYGKGAADDITEALIRRLAETPTGQNMLRALIGAHNEGMEEVFSDLLSPLADKIYKDKNLRELYGSLDPSEVLYDYLIGAAIGGFGAVGGTVSGQYAQANSENALYSGIYEQMGETPGLRQEARDRAAMESIGEERRETAGSRAREMLQALRGEESDSARAERIRGAMDALQAKAERKNGALISAAFATGGLPLSDKARETITANYGEGEAGIRDYTVGAMEAYRMGRDGAAMEATVEQIGRDFGLTPKQAREAWGFGMTERTQAGEAETTGTLDTSTEEGRQQLDAALANLGEHAQEAAALYDEKQDAGRYAAAMGKAATLYAAHGADLRQIVRDARDGKTGDLVGMLTDKQVELAEKIGAQQRQQTEQAVQAAAASRESIRQQADALRTAAGFDAESLQQTETAIDEARQAGQEAQDAFRRTFEALEAMEKADPAARESQAYRDALDEAYTQRDNVQRLQQEIRTLEAKKLELLGKKPVQRKKGTVSFEGGRFGGVQYKGVDPAKLDRQQKKVVAMVETLADAVNLDYVFVDADPGLGGAYQFGGRVFVNINSGRNMEGGFDQTMAAASLSHELTHFIQDFSEKEYGNLKNFVTGEILKADPQKLAQLVRQQQRWEQGRTLSYDQALDEVVANACQTMLLDSKAINKLARQNMGLAEKIADYIEDWGSKVRAAFEGVDTSDGAIFEALRTVEASIDEMQRLWDEGLEAAAENRDAETIVKQAAPVDDSLNVNSTAEAIDAADQAGVQYSRFVEDEDTLAFLNQQEKEGKVVHTYKSFLEIDGHLYPPMASMTKDENGKWKMAHAMEKGRWEESIGDPSKIIVDPKTGKGYFKLKKDNGSDIRAAYNPYQHSSNLMLNDQFSSAYQRPNIVTYECIIPESELTSGYRAEYAKDTVGLHPWKAGVVAGKIAKAKGIERQVYLSRWLKPIRKVPEAEVAQHYKELLAGTDIAVPSNVVTPALLEALEAAGVKIEYTEEAPKKAAPEGGQFQAIDSNGADTSSESKGQNQTWSDAAYTEAVEAGDMERAQQMVNAAAERAMPDSKIRTPDGKLRVVYHGTNSSGFTVFDAGYIGAASGDTGFFGRGFYFAYDSREAKYYGKNVMSAFLNIKNPFNFQTELNMLDGERTTDYNGGRAAFLINFAEKFPQLAKGKTVSAYDLENGSVNLSYADFAKTFRENMKKTKFEVEEREGDYGKEWLVKAGKHTESFTNRDGETFSWDEYDYQQTFTDERMARDKVANTYEYLKATKWSYIELPAQAAVVMDTDFTKELQRRGYDGAIQSEEGDEVVAFQPEQIKSADPVTYDDAGKVIPPSERFQQDNPDIRFQRWDDTDGDTAAEREGREVSYERIEAENAALRESIGALQALAGKQESTIGKLQKRLSLTRTPEVRESDARKMAKSLIREYGSSESAEDIAAELKEIGDYILQTEAEKLSEDALKERARKVAAHIIDSASEQVQLEDEALSDIRGRIKGKKLTISPDFLGELDSGFESFRRRAFGKFTLARADSPNIDRSQYTSVSQFYTDLQGEYGKSYFPDLANEGEEVSALVELMRASEPIEYNPFRQYRGEAVEDLANRIAMDALDGALRPVPATDADRAKSRRDALQEQIRQLKAEGKLQEREAGRLWQTVYDLTLKLDRAQSRFESLRTTAEIRGTQLREEGRAREAEARAQERERAAGKISALKAHYAEMTQNARQRREESAGAGKYRRQVAEKAGKLYRMLEKNDDKTHVPEVLKAPLAEFLAELDFTSRRALRGGEETRNDRAFGARLQTLRDLLENQQRYISGEEGVRSDLGGYLDVSADGLQFLRDTAELINKAMAEGRGYTVNSMSAAQLKDLSNLLSNLSSAIRSMNNFMANARYESVREAASADIEHMNGLGRVGEKENGKFFSAAFWQNGTPYYVLRRFGDGGRAIFDGLTRGWEKMAFNVKAVQDFTKATYSGKEVRAWQKERHRFTLEDGSEIEMTTGQIMSLSMLLGREQALRHLERGGLRIGDIETGSGKRTDTKHYHLTQGDITQILGALSERQREVAQKLQRFMATQGAEWGNEVSMRRFGYKFYAEGEHYFPIKTDSNDRPMADTDAQQNSMFRLLNLSSSKALNPKASNALVAEDIFDVFADHMGDMAKLNGLGLPILDAIKWFNYKERSDRGDGSFDTRTLQGAMEQAFGKQAQAYFRTLIKDVNGVTEAGDRGTGLLSGLMSNYKAAAVAANLRVAFLQPTSYVRAAYTVKPRYLASAFFSPNAYREAMEYSGTAVWKSLGYYDTNISRGMREQIKHAESTRDKIVEASMAGAELGDRLTWGRLWTACKLQTAAETGLKGEELKRATADLFRETVYATQVMDGTLNRSELMRGKTLYSKAMTAFMAEPTLSYNMLADAALQVHYDSRREGLQKAWGKNLDRLGTAFTTYLAAASFSAVVESVFDALRDDDEEEFFEKWKQALLGEGNILSGNLAQDLTVIGKLPYFKSFFSTLQGFNSGDMSLAAFNNLINSVKIWQETMQLQSGALEKPTKLTYYGKMTTWGKIYKSMQALSQLSGIGAANFARDAIAVWNITAGNVRPEWKVKTYDSGALSQSRLAAYNDTVKPTGISKAGYQRILAEANPGGGGVSQDELGAYLDAAQADGSLTAEQADAIWAAQGWKTGREAWKAAAEKKAEKSQYQAHLDAADADGNGSIKQDELAAYLTREIRAGRVSAAEAEDIWKAAGPGWKKSYAQYSGQEPTRGMPETQRTAPAATARTGARPHARAVTHGEGSARPERGRETNTFLLRGADQRELDRRHAEFAAENADELAALDSLSAAEWAAYVQNNSGAAYTSTDILDDPRIDREDAERYLQAQRDWEALVQAFQAGQIPYDEYMLRLEEVTDILEAFDEKYSELFREREQEIPDLRLVDEQGRPMRRSR